MCHSPPLLCLSHASTPLLTCPALLTYPPPSPMLPHLIITRLPGINTLPLHTHSARLFFAARKSFQHTFCDWSSTADRARLEPASVFSALVNSPAVWSWRHLLSASSLFSVCLLNVPRTPESALTCRDWLTKLCVKLYIYLSFYQVKFKWTRSGPVLCCIWVQIHSHYHGDCKVFCFISYFVMSLSKPDYIRNVFTKQGSRFIDQSMNVDIEISRIRPVSTRTVALSLVCGAVHPES